MNEDTPYHLGHVHLKVRDLDRAVAFYRAVFDLTVNETQGRFAFLTWGDHHHDVALQAVGAAAGNMIAIHNVVAASATVGLLGREGETLRKTILPTIYYCLLSGMIGLIAFYMLGIADPLMGAG